jgi:predicted Fe-S protein YdhL (DUF1289 family)
MNDYVCSSCGRSSQEAADWFTANVEQKREIKERAAGRLDEHRKVNIQQLNIEPGLWAKGNTVPQG